MLLNLSHKNFCYYKIIKYVGFESIHYAINLDVMSSSSKVSSEFDFMFLSNVLCDASKPGGP